MTDAIVIACIAALPGLAATLVARSTLGRQMDGIHILVNSQKDALMTLLTQALSKIVALEQRVLSQAHDIDQLEARLQASKR